MFVRYRQNFSSSRGKWQYGEYPDDMELSEIRSELREEYDWSEHYRGSEIEVIDRPPNDWLKSSVDGAERQIQRLTDRIARYKKLLEG